MHFSIIIPAYNEEELLGETLDRIYRCLKEIPNFKGEVIVVDNNSNDRTSGIAKSKGATVIFEPVNQISKARNVGARKAIGKYLFFIDADTFISQSVIVSCSWKGWNQGLVRVVARRSFLITIKTSSFLGLSFQSFGHAYQKFSD